MTRYDPQFCTTCDRKVRVTIFGTYRRHFALAPSGQLHLCPGSGCHVATPATARSALRPSRG